MSQIETHPGPTAQTLFPPFVDLRQFAERVVAQPLNPGHPESNAFLDNRVALDLPPGNVEVGVVRLPAGQGAVDALAADEFVILYDGAVTLKQGDQTLMLSAGASVVLNRGCGFTWRSTDTVTLIYMRYRADYRNDGRIVPINEFAPLTPSGTPPVDLLIGPIPQCHNHTDYLSPDDVFVCGTWGSTPYHRRTMWFRHYELMHLLEGSVTVEDEHGDARTFSKGDIFLMVEGANCSWLSREYVKKVYAIHRP